MKFWLGTHMVAWLETARVPLFVSRRRLAKRRRQLPIAAAPWALDSGGFTELDQFGEWRTSVDEYVGEVRRYASEVGQMAWAAPMDWMCEPFMLEKTGLTVGAHQALTVANFLELRAELGLSVIPVLQGWESDDYMRCWDLYDRAGVDLEAEQVVGLGSVCRRQDMSEAGLIVRRLSGLALHGFGVKTTGLRSYGDALFSADSMAWSYNARRNAPLQACTHKSCSNCLRFALRWRQSVVQIGAQLRLVEEDQ